MSGILAKASMEIQELTSLLLSTLDESLFFNELSKFLAQCVICDRVMVYKVLDDQSTQLIACNGSIVKDGKQLDKGQGPTGHVIRTKKSYFSNNVSRDPLFVSESKDGVQSELCIPVVVDNFAIATIHFQSFNGERKFERMDISNVIEILEVIKSPLLNMKMYLSAKHLNESLLKRIEEKENELSKRQSVGQFNSAFKISDKDIIGNSDQMVRLKSILEKVSKTNANALIIGENGCGKELSARKIHCQSERKDYSFLTVDCSALPEDKLEEEIFGVEIVEATGTTRVRNGVLEKANGGTVLIKSISKLPANLQSKLILYINQGMAFRVNGQMPYQADVRILASTVKNLEEEVEKNAFREDLFYALNTVNINVPALKERTDDIALLATFFLNEGKERDSQKSFSPGVIKAFREYQWPGNVRELQNVVERAYILSDGPIVEKNHISESIFRENVEAEQSNEEDFNYHEMTLDELEKKHICRTLDHLGGNKTKTAKMLGITVKTLYNKLHSYGMIGNRE
ncbi:MAG: sigma 54-interacting transcriptional regulator [Bacteriovoracaceae bacterium]